MKKFKLHGMAALSIAGLVVIGAGCMTSSDSKPMMKKATSAASSPVAATGAYYEIPHNGRLFIIGSAETAAKFKEHKHLPYTRTLIGAGPKGETLVFEVDKSNPAYVERLQKVYAAKHP